MAIILLVRSNLHWVNDTPWGVKINHHSEEQEEQEQEQEQEGDVQLQQQFLLIYGESNWLLQQLILESRI